MNPFNKEIKFLFSMALIFNKAHYYFTLRLSANEKPYDLNYHIGTFFLPKCTKKLINFHPIRVLIISENTLYLL
jgi:hypothetical protein